MPDDNPLTFDFSPRTRGLIAIANEFLDLLSIEEALRVWLRDHGSDAPLDAVRIISGATDDVYRARGLLRLPSQCPATKEGSRCDG